MLDQIHLSPLQAQDLPLPAGFAAAWSPRTQKCSAGVGRSVGRSPPLAACAACLALGRRTLPGGRSVTVTVPAAGRAITVFGLLVGIALVLMKMVPLIPGHFTVYEWVALSVWIALGVISYRKGLTSTQA